MNISEMRKKYPQYGDMSDMELATKFHQKHYSDIPFEEFAAKIELNTGPTISTAKPKGLAVKELSAAMNKTHEENRQRMGSVGRGLVESLPVAGGMIGGAPGVLTAATPGAPASPWLTVAGAGAGAAAGQSLKNLILQNIYGEQPKGVIQELKEAGQAGIEGIKGEMTGQIGGKVIEKAVAPALSKLVKGGRNLYEQAIKDNLPLSPDVMSKSRIARWATKIMDEVPPLSWGMKKSRQDLVEGITQMREDFITDRLNLPHPSKAGEIAEASKEAYAKATTMMGEGTQFSTPAVKKFLEENIDNNAVFGSKTISKQVKDTLTSTFKKLSAGDDLTTKEINNLWAKKNAGGAFKKLTLEQRGFFEKLKKALESDIQGMELSTGQNVAEAMKVADDAFLKKVDVGKARTIEFMLKQATDYDTKTEMYIFKPLKFDKTLQVMLPRLQKTLDPEQLTVIQEFNKKMLTAVPDVARFSQARQPGVAETIALAVPYGFTRFATNSMMNPKGWMKQWLTVGFDPTMMKAGARIGSHAATQAEGGE